MLRQEVEWAVKYIKEPHKSATGYDSNGMSYLHMADGSKEAVKSIKGAIKTFAPNYKMEDFIAFVDESVFQTGKRGVFIAKDAVFSEDLKCIDIDGVADSELRNINNISLENVKNVDLVSYEDKRFLYVTRNNGVEEIYFSKYHEFLILDLIAAIVDRRMGKI